MGAKVMVFAPAPLLTVTVEQVGDAAELHLHAGGQGLWQARMLVALGVDVTFCAALGGEVGRVLEPLITAEGVRLNAVRRPDDSGWYVHDRRDGERTVVAEESGAPLGRHELDELYTVALAEGLTADLSILSGPADPGLVEPDMYHRLATDLAGNGGKVAADLTGEQLDAVLDGAPLFVKVSDEEIGDTDPADALRELHERGAGTVVVSRAEQPALALVDGEALRVRVPRLEVADHHGAGDSLVAGMAAVLAGGGSMRDAIRAGAAAGALNVTRHGLGTGRADAIAALAERVELEPLP
ncbi:MAG TPA: PfkB family carbohydrate kinase [Kribbellaceae bacterium]